jgi:4-amino-4-deoxy-L-arabinose transferase-like glycosyltransferase
MRKFIPIILILIAIRIYALQFPALLDPTEARYAAISQRMVQTNQWLVPEIDRGDGYIPFWGKPPLHFWAVAASFKLLGFNEIAARLPSLIAALGACALASYVAYILFGSTVAALTSLILISTPVFNIFFGICLIDTTLSLFVAAAFACFATFVRKTEEQIKTYSDLLFFCSLSFGFMTKGPVALVLVLLPITIWSFYRKEFSIIKNLRWVVGCIIFILIVSPWFIVAENKTPGLIHYFFINENLLRFISPDYQDLYGSSHRTFRGAIALLLCVTFLPWIFTFTSLRRAWIGMSDYTRKWLMFCLLWGLGPVIFFSVSNNVIATYLLPGFAGLSIACAVLVSETNWHKVFTKFITKPLSVVFILLCLGLLITSKDTNAPSEVASSIPVLLVIALFYLIPISQTKISIITKQAYILYSVTLLVLISVSGMLSDKLSTKTMLVLMGEHARNTEIHFHDKLPYSAQFYSYRNRDDNTLLELLDDNQIATHGELILKRKSKSSELKLLDQFPNFQTDTWVSIDIDNTKDSKKNLNKK